MNLNTLRYVVTVAEERNFTRAAKRLFISQPSLSQSIQSLEQRLGTQLFDRKTLPVSLTEAGQIYVNWARQVLLSESQITREVKSLTAQPVTRLAVGIAPHRAAILLPPIIKALEREYPLCRIVVKCELPPVLEDKLSNHELDLVLDEAYLDKILYRSEFICNERMLLAVPSSYGMKKESVSGNPYPSLRLYQVKGHPFIALDNNYYLGYSIRAMCESEDFLPDFKVVCGDLALATKLVSMGLGVTIVPELYIRLSPEMPDVDYFTIAKIDPKRDLSLIYRSDHFLPEPATRMIALLRELYGSRPGIS